MGCSCHDVTVFGHGPDCRPVLEPRRAGSVHRNADGDPNRYYAEYGNVNPEAEYIRMVDESNTRVPRWYSGVIRSMR